MAKMHLLRAPSLGPRADDPDTFPRRGVRGRGRGIPLYAPASDHMPRTSRCHQEPTALGGTRICRGRVLGLTFSLSTAEGQAGEDRGLLLLGSRCGQRGQ